METDDLQRAVQWVLLDPIWTDAFVAELKKQSENGYLLCSFDAEACD